MNGRFRLDEEVGQGGMGTVFRAFDREAQREVALKLLGRTQREIERAQREAAMLARLEHPAIVAHVADGIADDGQLFLAMEWIEGVTLAERLASDGCSLREAVAVVRRIADALAAAHAAGVMHRDVKPSNVLLAANDPARATLIDFGIARTADLVAALTRTGAAIGTPGYMSPEQARGERALSPAADVFGLGCVLYECATGEPAFSGSIPSAVMMKILIAEPKPLREICGEAPVELHDIVASMMRKDAATRLGDGAAVVSALAALGEMPAGPRRSTRGLDSEPTAAAPLGGVAHVVVIASHMRPDDVAEPPSPEQQRQLAKIAAAHHARLESLATGAVVAHVTGAAGEATRRAARLALAVRPLFADWSIAIAGPGRDAGAAGETSASLLSTSVMAEMFSGTRTITVDAAAAALLEDEHEIVRAPRGKAKLVGPRRR